MFRLVLPEELSKQVAKRAQSKHGAVVHNHKAKKPARPNKPLQLDPNSFVLDEMYFQDEEEASVPQLSFDEVGAD